MIVGVLLVLLSIVLGVRYVSTADRTAPWLAARRPLPAGHVVREDDLTSVRAHLDRAAAGHYYPPRATSALVGARLAGPVGAGELLAAGDFVRDPVSATREVPVVVHEGRSPDLDVGDRVDVYVLAKLAGGADDADADDARPASDAEELVLHDVEFLGAHELASGDRSLLLRVPAGDAIAAVAASQSERVDVVLVASADTPTGRAPDPGPTSVPGYGT